MATVLGDTEEVFEDLEEDLAEPGSGVSAETGGESVWPWAVTRSSAKGDAMPLSIASRQAVPPKSAGTLLSPAYGFRAIEDRRTWTPYGRRNRPAASVKSPRHRLRASFFPSTYNVEFDSPRANPVMVCVRRWRRREVLAARGLMGRAMSKVRRVRPRRTFYSSVTCYRR